MDVDSKVTSPAIVVAATRQLHYAQPGERVRAHLVEPVREDLWR